MVESGSRPVTSQRVTCVSTNERGAPRTRLVVRRRSRMRTRWQGRPIAALDVGVSRQPGSAAAAFRCDLSSDLAYDKRPRSCRSGLMSGSMRLPANGMQVSGRVTAPRSTSSGRDIAPGRRPPGFEEDEDLGERVRRDHRDPAGHAGEAVLVVAHGGVVRTLERNLGDGFDGLLEPRRPVARLVGGPRGLVVGRPCRAPGRRDRHGALRSEVARRRLRGINCSVP